MVLRLPVISLALLSAAALAYELLLMRLFSIIHWHHYAYMVIGLALLGHGFSGSVVLVWQKKLIKHFRYIYLTCVLLFSLFSLISFQWAQEIPFNAEEILWDWRQSLYLLIIFLILTVPFFFVGAAICLAFIAFKQRMAMLYAADLFGAGVGCIGFVLLMNIVFPQSALFLVGLSGVFAATVAGLELALCRTYQASIIVILLIVLGLYVPQLPLSVSPYKGLPKMLLVKGTRVIEERSSPLGIISVLASDKIPLRYAPGMSFSTGSEPLEQLGVFTDADNMSVITRQPKDVKQLAYLDQMTSALPFHLQTVDKALVIGSGSGMNVLLAQFHQVNKIDAVELNPVYVELTDLRYRDFISEVYKQPGVSVHIADGRDFLNSHKQKFDLIQLTLLDSFNASAAGVYALNENYLYTVEALKLYLSRLEPGGYLAITRWLKLPPQDSLKLFNTALTVLKSSNGPGQQLLLIRSWQTVTLVIKNGSFTAEELVATETFCHQRNFDLVYMPDMSPEQANRYNVLKQPLFYQGVVALLSKQRQHFIEQYKFNLQPATDDRPYFQHFFRWSAFWELLQLRHKGGASLIETGYLVVFATLCIAVLSSFLLILGPLWWQQQNGLKAITVSRIKYTQVFGYFFAIGLGFLMIEIAFMQKFILFMHHPVYSAAAILTAFLVFAGLGSACSARLSSYFGLQKCALLAVVCIVMLSISYQITFSALYVWAGALTMTAKFILAISLIAPLAFFMGMPMPLALASLAEDEDKLIPWAWGINGCASVISSVLTVLLAMQFGFSVVIVTALLLYTLVIFIFPQTNRKVGF